jgi:hypothetical protein
MTSIKYIEKGIGLHEAISLAGHQLYQIGGEWVADDVEAVQAIIDSYVDTPYLRKEWKAARAAVVEAIKVTTRSGHTFDGDEVSQGRMARAILGLQVMPGETVTWVLADNSVIQATAAELSEALAMAGASQAAAWVDQ